MGMVKKEIKKIKLEAGQHLEGYLLSCEARSFDKGDETIQFATLKLQTKAGVVKTSVSSDFAGVLTLGQNTRVEKVAEMVDGEEKVKTSVMQDDADRITV